MSVFSPQYAQARACIMGYEGFHIKNEASFMNRESRTKCGALTRKGTPCRAPVVWDIIANRPRNGRCRMHGGLSTGPRTKEGQKRSLDALRVGNAAWRAKRA